MWSLEGSNTECLLLVVKRRHSLYSVVDKAGPVQLCRTGKAYIEQSRAVEGSPLQM